MDFGYFDMIILGLVQGLTEFLPVSSSGHLVVARHLLNLSDLPLIFDVFFHFATLLSILTYYRKDLLALFIKNTDITANEDDFILQKDQIPSYVLYLIIGTIPAAVIGLLYKDTIESFFSSLSGVGVSFIITGFILLSTRIIRKYKTRKHSDLTASKSFLIGVVQSAALFPGISRSGTTITGGLWLGLHPKEAIKFSFFLAVPAILGANILAFGDVSFALVRENISLLLLGAAAAFLSGLIAIYAVVKLVESGKFFGFGFYCLLLGIITLVGL